MKKITTTDQLKLVFQLALHADPDDWKRTNKAKNAKGEWVRDFENAKTGATIKVTETGDGQFNIKGKGTDMNVSLPFSFRKAAVNGALPVEDQIVEALMKGQDAPQDLLSKADPVKLAGKFSFTVIDEPDMGGVMAIVTPKGQDDEHSKKTITVMEHLFPKAEYIDDSVYGMWQLPDADTRGKLGATLEKAGFEWDKANKAEILSVKAPAAGKTKTKKI